MHERINGSGDGKYVKISGSGDERMIGRTLQVMRGCQDEHTR